jgi:dihydroorotate dehydrogenase
MYHSILKPLLFQMDPEQAHHLTMSLAKVGLYLPFAPTILGIPTVKSTTSAKTSCMGLEFPNPVGLAAGFDKDGKYLNIMEKLGFGFLELGTVTPRPQAGNPKPRLFRLPKDKALINRMGFNNEGVDALARRLEKRTKSDMIIGGNIGKNKDTSNESASDDYLNCFARLFDYVDYFTVNVSSPNTPGLRELQDKEPLKRLLNDIQHKNTALGGKPVLLKIAPDMNEAQLEEVCALTLECGLNGLVLTNTTISREHLTTPVAHINQIGQGGLSGAPLLQQSTNVVEFCRAALPESVAIVGVGGITEPKDALQKLKAGANLVQVYSGLVYYGPSLPGRINELILNEYDMNR